MMNKIPTDQEVKFDYVMSTRSMEEVKVRGEMFDKWLAKHDDDLLSYHGMFADWNAEPPF